MTAQVGSVLRCASRRAPQRWGLALLGTLLLVGCAEKEHFDQEVDLLFGDQSKRYGIAVAGEGDGGEVVRPVRPGSRHVLLRISGAMVKSIKIIVYDEFGVPLCEMEVVLDRPSSASMPYDVVVQADCGDQPDAGAPGPEAGTPPDAGPDGPSPACQTYCQSMRQDCPMVYPGGDDDCLATCAAYGWPTGDISDNSVTCRNRQALGAPSATSPLVPCYRAGPSGGNYCGTLCENYCQAAARACPGLEGDVASCLSRCQPPVAHPAYRSDTGDSKECRIFWLGEAIKTKDERICARLREGAQDPLCHD